MSAITTVKTTRNGIATLKYCNHQAKAHNNWDMKRVLALSASLGLTPDQAEKKMQEIWKQKGTQQKHQIEAYTIVQSFDPKIFDYKNQKDIEKVNRLGYEFASKAFAGRVFTVATQGDGKKHVLHNHITVCSQDPISLKSLRGVRTSVKYTREINDQILRENDYTPIKAQHLVKADSMAMRKLREKHPDKPLRVDVIRDRLDKLMSRKDLTTWDSLIKAGKKEKLDIRAKFNKKGTISRISYRLLDDDENLKMKQGIRPKKLGEIYEKRNISNFLQANAKFQKDRESDREAANRAIRGATADFEANFERTISKSPTVKNVGDRSQNREPDSNAVEDPSSTGGSQASFGGTTVYYTRSTSKRLRSPKNAFKRHRRKDGQLSQPAATDFPSFEHATNNAQLFTDELDELKQDFKLLNSAPDTSKLWWNAVFDDDTVTKLKQLFKEYADMQATKGFRGRANKSTRTDSRSHDDASDIDFDF